MGLLFQRGHSEDEKMCKETKMNTSITSFGPFFSFFLFSFAQF